jgi:hypothetical protein
MKFIYRRQKHQNVRDLARFDVSVSCTLLSAERHENFHYLVVFFDVR